MCPPEKLENYFAWILSSKDVENSDDNTQQNTRKTCKIYQQPVVESYVKTNKGLTFNPEF